MTGEAIERLQVLPAGVDIDPVAIIAWLSTAGRSGGVAQRR
jgi:hypothetical protein